MVTCPQCGREHQGAGPLCDTCLSSASASAPVVVTPAGRDLSAPVTVLLVLINAAVFLFMLAKGTPLMKPNSAQILRFGANFGPLSLGPQWWRMLTAMFVHIGLVHLLINEWCLWDLGYMAEHLFGTRTFLAVYLISGLTGSLVSVTYNPSVVSAGASGAIFGIAGALMTTLYFGHIPVPRSELRWSQVSLLVFTVFSLAYGFQHGGIDNGAHVGGLVAGLIMGAILSRDFGTAPEQHHRVHVWAIPLIAVILVAAIFAARYYERPMVELAHAETTVARGDLKGGITELKDVVRARPRYANAWMALAAAYLRNNQLNEGEAALKRASELDPKSEAPLAELSVIYLRTNRFQEASDVLGRLTQIDPKNVEAYINRGYALNRLDKPHEAMEAYQRATSLNPKNPTAWYNLGLSYMSLKQYDKAIAAFQQVSKLAPDDAETYIWLSNAYQQKGMHQEADAAYTRGLELRQKQLQRMQQRQRRQ